MQIGMGLRRQRVAFEPLSGTTHRLWFQDVDLGTIELPVETAVIDAVVQAHLEAPLRRRNRAGERAERAA